MERSTLTVAAVVTGLAVVAIAVPLLMRAPDDPGPRQASGNRPVGVTANPGGGGAAAVEAVEPAADSSAREQVVGTWRPSVSDLDGVAAAIAGKTLFRFDWADRDSLKQTITMGQRRGQPELLLVDDDGSRPGALTVSNSQGDTLVIRVLNDDTLQLEPGDGSRNLMLTRATL